MMCRRTARVWHGTVRGRNGPEGARWPGIVPAGGREAAAVTDELGPFAALVLDVVDRVPPGQVTTYGDVAEYLGQGGPRQVGAVLAEHGGAVAWWRVVRAD